MVGLPTAALTLVALPLLAVPALTRAWAEWHRQRAGGLLGSPIAPRPMPHRGRRPRVLTDAGSRRDLTWSLVHVTTGAPAGLFAVWCMGNLVLALVVAGLWWAFPAADPPRLLVGVPVTGWVTALTTASLQVVVLAALACVTFPLLARIHARICLRVLSPSAAEQLAERVEVLTQTRTGALDAHGVELHRIERDLHDGPQARLTAIAVRLGIAREAVDDPELVARLLREAHEGAEVAMTELRAVIRTIHPPILSDRGLDGAVSTLVAACPVPVTSSPTEVGRLPATVETAAYFTVSEALANVTRHSRAAHATLGVTRRGDRLIIRITDDGIGGADERRGTGLTGVRRRVAALDGRFHLSSPPDGPTELTVELPCGS